MTQPNLTMDLDGLAAFVFKCEAGASDVTTGSAPPPVSPAAMSQGTGQASAALHAVVEQVAAAMSRELVGTGTKTASAGQSMSSNETASAVKLGDLTTPLAQVGSSVTQGFSTAFGGTEQALAGLSSGGLQSVTGLAGHVIDHPGSLTGDVGDLDHDGSQAADNKGGDGHHESSRADTV